MKLLLFGANSQLGQELARLFEFNEVDFVELTTDEVDILNLKDVIKAISRVNPTQLINVSTYSNLQKAESDADAARMCELVNTEGVTALGKVCNQLGIPVIHHSSSYVFDGKKKETYHEEDETNPVCQYGKSKWYGERTLREETERHIILRTDWLFSSYRKNYFKKYIDECKTTRGKIGVLDNRFSPTHTFDAARVIYAIVKQVDCNAEVWGTYHYNAMQPVKQDQFVHQVIEEAAKLDKELEEFLPSIEIEHLPVELPFISNSALNCDKIMATFGIKQRSRGEGLIAVLEEMYGVKKPASVKKKVVKAKKESNDKKTSKKPAKKTNTKNNAARAKSPRRSKQPAKKAAKRK